jgi:malonyl-CoA O-methyltransferase
MKTLMQRIGIFPDRRTSLQKSIDWVKDHRVANSGIVVHHKTKTVTPEVTGYLITSLYNAGEKELAFDLAQWEASIQKKDGSFAAPGSDVSYTFDTAQVIRGYLSVLDEMPELENNLRRACDYVDSYIDSKGEVLTVSYDMWKLADGSKLSDYGNLYVLPPMLEAGKKLGEKKYISAAQRGMNYFRKNADLVEFKPSLAMLSHYFGYMMEALVDLGETELAQKGLKQAQVIQMPDGSIPAYPGATWVCSTGMAQLALAWYKMGIKTPADKAMAYLEKIQNSSGGFYGGYGKNVEYFHNQEISWAVKFFIDANYWREFNV